MTEAAIRAGARHVSRDGGLSRTVRRLAGGDVEQIGTQMSRLGTPWVRRLAAAATLAVVAWRVGTGPFLDGLRAVDAPSLAAAAAIGLITTAGCAWRWTLVARGHGMRLSFAAAVAGYYRSVFLNLTLPGGVVGDVHRGVSQGRGAGDVGRGLRVVAWERGLGQCVQLALTAAVLLVLPSPLDAAVPLAAAAVAAAAVLALVVWLRRGGHRVWVRRPWALPAITLASVLVVAGNAAMFMVAARTAGVSAAPSRMLPLALLVLAAAALPNVAGWGPREGATAWAFGAAGLGAAAGVTTAVVFGVMALVASLPGAVVLVSSWARRQRRPGYAGMADA